MKLIFFFLTTLFFTTAKGQVWDQLSYSIHSKTGFLIAHRPVMSHLIKERNFSFELDVSQQVIHTPIWSTLYKMPMRGLSFSYQDFGNKEQLGQAYSLFQHSSFPLIANEKFGFIDFRLGAGVSYISKKYDADLNPKNNAIGSNINAIVDVEFVYTKYFKKFHIGAGIEITHYSNAALIKPNLGLNTPLLFLKVGFNPEKRATFSSDWNQETDPVFENIVKSRFFNISMILTGKQNLPAQNASRFYPVIGVQGLYSHHLNHKWNFESAIDIIYNEANRHFYDESEYNSLETFQVGLYAGASAKFMKTQVYFGLGGYVKNTINPAGHFYNRIGYRYHFNNKWTGMIGIMANLGKADYLEFGFGYVIPRKAEFRNEKKRKKNETD